MEYDTQYAFKRVILNILQVENYLCIDKYVDIAENENQIIIIITVHTLRWRERASERGRSG
jgi:hypothetical protein